MPRCVFGDGAYRCTKRGIGIPPLCREHYELVAGLEEEEADDDEGDGDFFDNLFENLLEHPYVREKIEEVVRIIKDPAARHPNYQGPGMAYAAECPPRPRAQRPPPRQKPPDPPKTNGLTAPQAREILHFSATQVLTATDIRKRQRQLARLAHPDVGGTAEAMARINAAATFLISQVG